MLSSKKKNITAILDGKRNSTIYQDLREDVIKRISFCELSKNLHHLVDGNVTTHTEIGLRERDRPERERER